MMRTVRNVGICAAAIGVAILLLSTVLPWLSQNGYAGQVIQRNYRDTIDATPLFYTECERTAEISRTVASRRSPHGR
ncbi:MAG: hypothetical protein AMXMBFR4_00050 [Candidatus Hydrogenedentota bacterium]